MQLKKYFLSRGTEYGHAFSMALPDLLKEIFVCVNTLTDGVEGTAPTPDVIRIACDLRHIHPFVSLNQRAAYVFEHVLCFVRNFQRLECYLNPTPFNPLTPPPAKGSEANHS